MEAVSLHKNITELKIIARDLRKRIIKNSHDSKTPHLGSCLSVVDILTVLYFHTLKLNPSSPETSDRDRFVLSKGHAAPALFYTLMLRGFFKPELMKDYGKNGSLFGEHPPTPNHLNGIEAATGSLGHGLPMGVGMAIAGALKLHCFRVYVLVGDGECNEGTIWEAAMFAAAKKIKNLTVIIDFNKWQATGRSEEIMQISSLFEKWEAFGWETFSVDGHNIGELISIFDETKKNNKGPIAIIANTTKGKGVSFMEDDNNWHYKIPTLDEVNAAQKELDM